MCGLFGGYSSWLSELEKQNVTLLGGLSFTRGLDGTGMAHVERNNKKYSYHSSKALLNPVSFFNHTNTQMVLKKTNLCILMGHARQATLGEKTIHNTQPICTKDLIVCHNGTVLRFKGKDEEDSDSRNLSVYLDEHGIEETINEIGQGSAALTWLDKKKNTLNFFRNINRPLWILSLKSGATIYWASEKWMLDVLKDKSANSFAEAYMLPIDTVVTYELCSTVSTIKKIVVEKKQTPTPTIFHHGGGEYIKVDGVWRRRSEISEISGVSEVNKEKDIIKAAVNSVSEISKQESSTSAPIVLPTGSWYNGFNNSYLSIKQAEKLMNGSACCLCIGQRSIHDTVYWVSPTKYLCALCHNYPELAKTFGQSHVGRIKHAH